MTQTYAPIVMDAPATEGAFVRTLVGQTGTGFREGTHVHKDWWAKTLSFDEVMDHLESERGEREDIEDTLDSMTPVVDPDGEFAFQYKDGRYFYPTDNALCQFGVWVGLSTFFLRDLRKDVFNAKGELLYSRDSQDAEVLVQVCQNALRRIEGNPERKWRTYSDGTLRAWLSDRYVYIDNRWYLEFIHEILPDARYSHWKGDADTIYGNVLIPDSIMNYPEDNSDYGGMVSLGNCEIGTRKLTQLPSLFRSICMNGCIWGRAKGKGIGKVHRGEIDYDQLKESIYTNITAQIPLFAVGLDALLEKRSYDVAEVTASHVIAQICKDYGLNAQESLTTLQEYASYESENRNLFGVINAITRAGQKFAPSRWVETDAIGGTLAAYDRNAWDRTLHGARSLSRDDVLKVFGNAV